VSDKKLHEIIKLEIKDYFPYDDVDLKKYDKYKAGLSFVSKEELTDEDCFFEWKFLW